MKKCEKVLSFSVYIKEIYSTAFLHVRNYSKIRNILSQSYSEKLVHAFIYFQVSRFLRGE